MRPEIDRTGLILIVSVIVLGVFALVILEQSTRTPSEKIGDSVTNIIDKTGENLKDLGNEIEDKIDSAGGNN